MLARNRYCWITFVFAVSTALLASASLAQTKKKAAPINGGAAPVSRPKAKSSGEPLRVAERGDADRLAPTEVTSPPSRDPSRKVVQVASLTADEVKAKQSTAIRRSVTVYVPKLVSERQNVARTIMAPVTSNELRPVWSPGQNRWLTYQQTGQTMWSQRVEVVPMDVPVWKYVAETRYIEEPIVRQNFYTPIQTSPAAAWAWKQPGPDALPLIPSIPSRGQRPVISFLQSRPVLGRFFGGGGPLFAPPPAPVGPVAANYQPVSYYQPNFAASNYAPPAAGTGIPGFSAPPLPTSGATGNFGGVRTFQ